MVDLLRKTDCCKMENVMKCWRPPPHYFSPTLVILSCSLTDFLTSPSSPLCCSFSFLSLVHSIHQPSLTILPTQLLPLRLTAHLPLLFSSAHDLSVFLLFSSSTVIILSLSPTLVTLFCSLSVLLFFPPSFHSSSSQVRFYSMSSAMKTFRHKTSTLEHMLDVHYLVISCNCSYKF